MPKEEKPEKERRTIYVGNLAKGIYKMPKFAFNRKLFERLIREKLAQSSSGEKEPPKVVFEAGPIDNVLGTFNQDSKRITIDYLEIYFATLMQLPLTEEEFSDAFDRYLTKILAHEGGHWQLDAAEGKKANFDRIVLFISFLAIGLVPLYFFAKSLIPFAWGLVSSLYAWSWLSGLTLGSVTAAISVVLILVGFLFLLIFAFAFSCALTYKLCKHERFARECKKDTEKDKRWRSVIRIG